MKKINKLFNWKIDDVLRALIGSLLFCFAINTFVVPNHLYTGGILGFSQILRTAIISTFNITPSIDISSIIYYLINIPLFITSIVIQFFSFHN